MKSFLIKYLLFSLSIMSLNASATGFVGKLVLEPRDKPYYEVMQDFSFIDKDGYKWTTRKGYKTDGASIPRLLWSVIGDPYGGGYIKSAVIHDQACDDRERTWKQTHRVFFDAMIEEGVNPSKAYIMYAAVYRFGPRWELKYPVISKIEKPNYKVKNKACYYCSEVETLNIDESRTITASVPTVVDIPISEELTQEKLNALMSEVQKLEAKGPVNLNDLENLKIDQSANIDSNK